MSEAAAHTGATYGSVRRVSLEPQESSDNSRGAVLRFGHELVARLFPLGYWREFRQLIRLQVPAFLTCFFQFFLQTVSVIMCGHLSKEELDAVALACTLINVAGMGVGLGLSTGCDTYFSQTYGNNKRRVGLYLQRSLIVMYMFLVPVYCLHLNIRPLLLLLGQEPRVSDMTARYVLLFMPGVFCDFTFLVLARYLQTQNRVNPPLACAFVGNVFNVVSQYVAIFVLGFRYEASAVCQAASLGVMCACVLAYILASGAYRDTWSGWTREAWYDIGGFVRLAVPGLLFVALEELCFEVGTFVAGTIDSVQLAAQGIVFQAATLSYMVSVGMSIAVNIRVGQQLGAQRPEAARHTYRVAVSVTICVGCCLALLFAVGNRFIASLFTDDPEVREATAQVLAVYAAFPLIDGMSATGSGVLKGCGRQLVGAAVNIVVYNAVALPLGVSLSLATELRIRGMWLGLLLGLGIVTLLFWILILRTDWRRQTDDALRRATGDKSTPASEKEPLLRHRPSESLAFSRSPYHSDAEVEVTQPRSLPPFRPVLARRIAAAACLLAALAAAVLLRFLQPPLPTSDASPTPAANDTGATFGNDGRVDELEPMLS